MFRLVYDLYICKQIEQYVYIFLQIALSATPLFEPSVIPLLLEKLSSSLPSAKVGAVWIHLQMVMRATTLTFMTFLVLNFCFGRLIL